MLIFTLFATLFRTLIYYRPFQKFLLVIDNFGPNRFGKICAEVTFLVKWNIKQAFLRKTNTFPIWYNSFFWFLFIKELKRMLLRLFENFDRQFWRFSGRSGQTVSKYPKFQDRPFQIFWTYIYPWGGQQFQSAWPYFHSFVLNPFLTLL